MSEFPYFLVEHFENEDFPEPRVDENGNATFGWCTTEYLNILRVATPGRVIITNITKENQAKLPPVFQLCAAISDKSLLDYLYNKDDINNDPNTPQVLKDLVYYHHNNAPVIPVDLTQNQSTQESTAITSTTPSQICFLDEFGTGQLVADDINKFKYLILGGILGTEPSTDRGGHLRNHGFQVRMLGTRQLSTDTAAVKASVILRHGVKVEDLEYLDDPEVFEDEVDKIPLIEQIAKGQAKKKQLRKMRESTAIRMRYLTHQQACLDGKPEQTPRDVISIDRTKPSPMSTAESVLNETRNDSKIMKQFPCMCDCSECIEQIAKNGNQCCDINHAGDWYHSRPQCQVNLWKETNTRIPRMTPGLLQHIFSTLDDGIIDLEGNLDIDFEAMELGIDEAEDKELCKILFME